MNSTPSWGVSSQTKQDPIRSSTAIQGSPESILVTKSKNHVWVPRGRAGDAGYVFDHNHTSFPMKVSPRPSASLHVALMPTQVTFSGESLFSSDPIVSIAHSAAFDYVSIQPSASERPLEELSLSRSEAGRASEHSLGTGHHERQCNSAGLRSRRH